LAAQKQPKPLPHDGAATQVARCSRVAGNAGCNRVN
jgi:hypothetical protein